MSTQRRRLGRGLDALLGEPPAAQSMEPSSPLRHIDIGAIRPNRQQPRRIFDPAALSDLEGSIRELGVLVPILVRPAYDAEAERYELIAGERRWRAAAAAGLATIPAIVREADDRSSLEVAVVENLQRQDLDPLEEAMGFQHLVDDYGLTQDEVAERIGKSRPSVANALRLLSLEESLQAMLRSKDLTVGHARALLAVAPELRVALAQRIVRDGLSVRQVEEVGSRRKAHRPVESPTPPGSRHATYEAVKSRLRYALGAAAAIVPGKRGGKLEIRYADEGELTRIVDLIVGEEQ